jgi:hypothetical protein
MREDHTVEPGFFFFRFFMKTKKSHHFERSCNFSEKGTHGVMLYMPMFMERGVMFQI